MNLHISEKNIGNIAPAKEEVKPPRLHIAIFKRGGVSKMKTAYVMSDSLRHSPIFSQQTIRYKVFIMII